MIEFLNKLLSRFKLQVVTKETYLWDDIENNPWFLMKYPDFMDRYKAASRKNTNLYRGEINYIKDKDGKTYYKDLNSEQYFCDYDLKNPSKEVLDHMIAETTFTKKELKEKLNDCN